MSRTRIQRRHAITPILLGLLLTAVLLPLYWFNHELTEYYPHDLLDSCPHLPISPSERDKGVIAKFEVNKVQADRALKWYKSQGFSMGSDTLETYGLGPDGLSFSITATENAQVLVVVHWVDW